ncbi:DUF6049 family protein [Aquipuribacter hungaricus]|uniref:DUF6049 family protein n=1 Tax=Aquipuribacter hungaricus TaxID=545624 RepID=UPI00361FAFAB
MPAAATGPAAATPAAATVPAAAAAPSAATAPAAPGDPADGSGADEAGVEVTSLLPAELRPGGRVTVRGRVSGGEDGLVGARVELRRAPVRSSSVSSLERWTAPVDEQAAPAADPDDPGGAGGTRGGAGGTAGGVDDPAEDARTEVVVQVGDVPAGEVVPFVAVVEASATGLRSTAGAAGAYGLQVLLLDEATTEGADGPGPVDDERGFLVWTPEVDVAPTRLVTTVPLQGPPPTTTTGLPEEQELLDALAPGGRLDRLLPAAAVLDAGWVVDPVLLAGAAAAAGTTDPGAPAPTTPDDPAATAAPGDEPGDAAEAAGGSAGDAAGGAAGEPAGGAAGGTAGGAGGPQAVAEGAPSADTTASDAPAPDGGSPAGPAQAAAWLAALAVGRDGRDVVLADWADPDPARVRSAADPDAAWAVVRAARQAALPDGLAEQLLDGSTRSDVLVVDGPAADRVSGRDVATLAQGRSSVVLPEEAVPLSDPFALSYTPDAVTEVDAGGSTLTAVLADATLGADTAAALEGSPLALTRVVARLATTTLQRPNDPRLLAVTLPADLSPVPGAAQHVADALSGTPWADTVSLSTALGTPPSTEPREPLPGGRSPQVPGVDGLLEALADARQVAAAAAVPEDPVQAAALDLRAAASLSRSTPPEAPAELAALVREQTRGTVDGVQVVPGSRVTLVAAEAGLPVTVVNELDTEVSLVLEVRSRSPRLQVPQARVPVTVQPGQRTVVDVPVVAVASGAAEVESQLTTADGRAWGPVSSVDVTVATQAEGRALTVVGVVVAVVFVVGAARAFVRDRRGRELVGAGPVEP